MCLLINSGQKTANRKIAVEMATLKKTDVQVVTCRTKQKDLKRRQEYGSKKTRTAEPRVGEKRKPTNVEVGDLHNFPALKEQLFVGYAGPLPEVRRPLLPNSCVIFSFCIHAQTPLPLQYPKLNALPLIYIPLGMSTISRWMPRIHVLYHVSLLGVFCFLVRGWYIYIIYIHTRPCLFCICCGRRVGRFQKLHHVVYVYLILQVASGYVMSMSALKMHFQNALLPTPSLWCPPPTHSYGDTK